MDSTNPTRTIEEIRWTQSDDQRWAMNIRGTAFLKHMVRNIVGTLVDVGRGHRPASTIQAVLAARNRCNAGPTAPAAGLVLQRIFMNEESAD